MKTRLPYFSTLFSLPGRELRVFYPTALVAFCFAMFAYTGCKLPNDGVPIYMKVDSVTVATTANQGIGSHNITDVWVEANTDNLGAYGVPANFPVLQENEVGFVMTAGIKETGQSGVRVVYPFYSADTFTIDGVRGTQYTHNPVFEYRQSAKFALVDDFNSGNSFSLPSDGSASIVSDGNVDPVYGGSRCLKLNVSALDSSTEVASVNAFDLPEGLEIWLEVDYKAEVPFYIGFNGVFNNGVTLQVPVLFVNPQAEWSKVYVKLSLLVGQTRADTYKIFFEALRPYGSTGGNVYIDNIKVVHF
ncbi:MAG TPA: hypothetical protein VK154_00870 [Chitinophagales bacterium]|nr:hypothetical protein [Chitinophagales bacterium]